MNYTQPPKPTHIPGTNRGEELVQTHGREPGRDSNGKFHRTSRDSTGLNPDQERPIDPRMPQMPPA